MPNLVCCQWAGDAAGDLEGSPLKFLGVIECCIRSPQEIWPAAGMDGV